MHIHRNIMNRKGRVYQSILLRESYYDRGKRRKKTIASLTKMPEYLIHQIELALMKEEMVYRLSDLEFTDGYPLGHIGALSLLASEIGLDELLYSKAIKELKLALMMIIARVLHPSSKLENTR